MFISLLFSYMFVLKPSSRCEDYFRLFKYENGHSFVLSVMTTGLCVVIFAQLTFKADFICISIAMKATTYTRFHRAYATCGMSTK